MDWNDHPLLGGANLMEETVSKPLWLLVSMLVQPLAPTLGNRN